MKDGPGRRVLKRAALLVFHARLWAHDFQTRDDRQYELAGACARSGQCCEAPGIGVSRLVWYVPLVRRAFLSWHRRVNGFVLREARLADRAFIFECTHYDRETRSCDSYGSRPGMCRDYPRVHLGQANPELFEHCGFKLLARKRASMLRELDSRALSEEQMRKLKRGLHLE